MADPELMERIKTWPLPNRRESLSLLDGNPPELTFAQTLSSHHSLYRRNAELLESEYRRWLYLCSLAGQRVAPPPMVARAEALHMSASIENWRRLHTDVLHITPTMATKNPKDLDIHGYRHTRDQYIAEFGSPSLPKAWPKAWRLNFYPSKRIARALVAIMLLCGVGLVFWGDRLVHWLDVLLLSGFVLCLALGCIAAILGPWATDDNGVW